MYRRLYFLLPDPQHTAPLVHELIGAGVPRDHLHALARPGTDLAELPAANQYQRSDTGAWLERILWNGNLLVFFFALAVLVAMLVWAPSLWALIPVAIMAATFIGGLYFTRVPNVHLAEFHDALRHGEVLLMVDSNPDRVHELEDLVHRHHPEATVGGVGWTIEPLRL